MAGKLRYWKEKDGRFWARIAVSARLRPFLEPFRFSRNRYRRMLIENEIMAAKLGLMPKP